MRPLGDGCRAHRLAHAPPLTEVPAPEPGPRLAAALERVRGALPGMGMFDGPIAVPVAAGPDGIAYYRATYAWNVAQREGEELPGGRGLVAVALLLHDGDGNTLWQRRAETVAFAGMWDVTAAGAWHPGEDLEAAALREAHEELGCAPDALGAPDGRWLTVGRDAGAARPGAAGNRVPSRSGRGGGTAVGVRSRRTARAGAGARAPRRPARGAPHPLRRRAPHHFPNTHTHAFSQFGHQSACAQTTVDKKLTRGPRTAS